MDRTLISVRRQLSDCSLNIAYRSLIITWYAAVWRVSVSVSLGLAAVL